MGKLPDNCLRREKERKEEEEGNKGRRGEIGKREGRGKERDSIEWRRGVTKRTREEREEKGEKGKKGRNRRGERRVEEWRGEDKREIIGESRCE